MNTYALTQDLLPILQKHGFKLDGIRTETIRRRFFEPRGPDRIFLIMEGHE